MSYTLTGIRSSSGFSSSPATVNATVAVSTGDLVILGFQCGTSASLNVSSVLDLNDSSLALTKLYGINDATNANALQLWISTSQSAHTPSWKITYSGVGGSTVLVMSIKVNSTSTTNWTYDQTFGNYTTSGNSSSTVMSWATGNTDQANTVVMAMARVNGAVSYSDPAGWTGENGDLYAQMFASSGSATSASTGTFSIASQWNVIVTSVYDASDNLMGQAIL